jgi:FixJ family two-component response regulator
MPNDSIVYLIHDDDLVRERAGKIIDDMGIAAQVVESAEELVEAYDDSRDSCLITDLKLHGCMYVDLQRVLEDQSISMPPIVVTSHTDVRTAIDVMRSGAVTLMETPLDEEQLRAAIVEAITRDSIERKTKLRRHEVQSRIQLLTDKERRVLGFVVDGMANKVIAKRMRVSIRTIESRRQAVFQKMQVGSLAELVRSVLEADSGDF